MRNFSAVPLVILFFTVQAYAQASASREAKSAIETISKIINGNHVFPPKGSESAKHLLLELRKGKFKNGKSWKAVDSIATKYCDQFKFKF